MSVVDKGWTPASRTQSALFLPTFLILWFFRMFWWLCRISPRLRKKVLGTVGLTAVGMFGEGAGWGIPPATPQTLYVTVGGIGTKREAADAAIATREYLSLTVSFDHEMIDGAPATRFTRRLKELIESGYGLDDSTWEAGLDVAHSLARESERKSLA